MIRTSWADFGRGCPFVKRKIVRKAWVDREYWEEGLAEGLVEGLALGMRLGLALGTRLGLELGT